MKREDIENLSKECLVDFTCDAYFQYEPLRSRIDAMLINQTRDIDRIYKNIDKLIKEVNVDRSFFTYKEISFQENRLQNILTSIEEGLVALDPTKAARALCAFIESHENVYNRTDDECIGLGEIYGVGIDLLIEVLPKLPKKEATSTHKRLQQWKESDDYGIFQERDFSELPI
jgi:hypothetical protein